MIYEINEILDRKKIKNEIIDILSNFENESMPSTFKKGIYIYGSPGCGKSFFIENILKELDYDTIKYDAGDVRNKNLIETITSNNISNCNVLHMMSKKKKKLAIIMDEIDGMNNGDKGGINSLIKIIRQKKTKKQKLENKTSNPIICIGNYYVDKKIKELIKVCNSFELKKPNELQTDKLINMIIPMASTESAANKIKMIQFIQGDMRKLFFVKKVYEHFHEKKTQFNFIEKGFFNRKSFNEDSKNNTKFIMNNHISIKNHNAFINETDRTIISLLWHENIIDVIPRNNKKLFIAFYLKILDNICFADYTDRITFQNQIWQFNEMSSLVKTFYNNFLFHETFPEMKNFLEDDYEIRFTKVLTKYSTEYNNFLFIFNLCQQMSLDKKDLLAFFNKIRRVFEKEYSNSFADFYYKIEKIIEPFDISKLDIKRMYRYIDLSIKTSSIEEESDED